ncbi:MAG: hypothetical protein ACRD1Z_02485, partial [Vicinamibacteria bacterium]
MSLASACGGPPPEQTFKVFAESFDKGDYEACWSHFSSNARDHYERLARELREEWPKLKAKMEEIEKLRGAAGAPEGSPLGGESGAETEAQAGF